MNTNSAFTGLYTENPFWHQQFDLRQIRILSGGQPIVNFDAVWYVPPLCYGNESNELSRWYPYSSNWYFQRPICTSVWFEFDARCYRKLSLPRASWRTKAGARLYLSSGTHSTELIVLGERMSLVTADKFGVVRKTSKVDNVSLQQVINRILLLKYPYCAYSPSDYVPFLDKDFFCP